MGFPLVSDLRFPHVFLKILQAKISTGILEFSLNVFTEFAEFSDKKNLKNKK